MSIFDDHFHTTLAKDIATMIIGKKIGEGQYREVYQHAATPDYVVKIENGAHNFHNVREWDLWKAAEGTALERWLAPCYSISQCGTVLVMRKVERVPAKLLPRRVPAVFTDLKPGNWGLLGTNVVCCDYGLTLCLQRGVEGKALRLADWWDD